MRLYSLSYTKVQRVTNKTIDVADREELCIYDIELQQKKLLHIQANRDVRLLTHFYAFIFFADWKQDLFSKRLVRDHVRIRDEIMCAAARVLEAVRERAKKKPGNPEGLYDALHVRRGSIQINAAFGQRVILGFEG